MTRDEQTPLSVRPMRLDDLPEVMEISRQSLPQPWSEGIWRGELKSPFGSYLVLEEGAELHAFIGVKLVSDEMHVMTIAVRPESRRRGLARRLVDATLFDPAFAEARRIHLEVRPGNFAARALYDSLGFVQTGVRPRYYGSEDALLMTLDLRGRRRLQDGRAPREPPGGGEGPPGSRKASKGREPGPDTAGTR